MVTSWQKDSLSQRAAVELQGCRFNSCWQACNCIKNVCTSTSVGSTNVKLLCWVVILLPEKKPSGNSTFWGKALRSKCRVSACFFQVTTQHSNCNCIPLQLLSHSSKKHMLTPQLPFEISVYKKHDQSAIIALLK
jgi:hypothetical protein